MQRISSFLEDHAPSIVVLTFLLAVGAYVMLTGLLSPDPNQKAAAADESVPVPTASLTAQGFPAPGTTLTMSHHIKRKDGSIATRTVREYVDGENRVIRETVREVAPGVRVTSTQTIVAAGPTNTVMSTATARETVLTRETIVGPGGTVTIEVPVPVTVAGPESTTTTTETATETRTETVSVPGPETTTTETVHETQTETVTVTETPPPPPSP